MNKQKLLYKTRPGEGDTIKVKVTKIFVIWYWFQTLKSENAGFLGNILKWFYTLPLLIKLVWQA